MVIDSSRSAIFRSRPQALELCTACPSVTTFSQLRLCFHYALSPEIAPLAYELEVLTCSKCSLPTVSSSTRTPEVENHSIQNSHSLTSCSNHDMGIVGWLVEKEAGRRRSLWFGGAASARVARKLSDDCRSCARDLSVYLSVCRYCRVTFLQHVGDLSPTCRNMVVPGGLLWTHSPNLVAPGNTKVATYKIVYEVPNR